MKRSAISRREISAATEGPNTPRCSPPRLATCQMTADVESRPSRAEGWAPGHRPVRPLLEKREKWRTPSYFSVGI